MIRTFAILLIACLCLSLPVLGETDSAALRELAKVASKGNPEERASAVRRIAAWLPDREAVRVLASVLTSEKDSVVLMNALQAIGGEKGAELYSKVYPLCFHPDLDVRKAAASAASSYDSELFIRDLMRDATARKPEAAEAVRALARVLNKENHAKLLPLVRTGVPAARAAAIAALMTLGATDARDEMRNYLQEKDLDIVRQAIQACAFFRDGSAIPQLIEMLDNKDLQVFALDALKTLTGRKSPADTREWRSWWRENSKAWTAPEFRQLGSGSEVEFFEHRLNTKRIVLVLDHSDSMGSGNGSSFEAQKAEVYRFVASLTPNVSFNCVVYGRSASVFDECAVEADAPAKRDFFAWLSRHGTENNTATYDALKAALAVRDADTVILCSNGIPNSGELPNGSNPEVEDNVMEAVTKSIRDRNLKVKLYTVGFPYQPDIGEEAGSQLVGKDQADKVRTFERRAQSFLRLLASLHGGYYCFVDVSQTRTKPAGK